jgi:signal transduction histidine kinase
MSADRLASPGSSAPPAASAAAGAPPAGVHRWEHDVGDGVARRFAIAVIPALLLALIARSVRGDWDMVILIGVTLAGTLATLTPGLSSRARALLIVAQLVYANWYLMAYADQVPFHGVLVSTGAAFALLMGGLRWGVWTLAILSGTWLVPWVLAVSGRPSPVDMPWPSQYLRLWFFHTSLAAGLVATIRHVVRVLESSIERGDRLVERVSVEARAAQALAGRVTEAEESERSRLARELHDDLGQRLTALKMKLQLSRRAAAAPQGAIDECVTIAEELLRDVRSFARGLRPPLIDEVGLGPALRALVEQHAGSPTVSIVFDGPESIPRLPPATEIAAYRVFQEALSNALRHAGAARLVLAVRHDAGAIVVSLADDGKGFDPGALRQAAVTREHLGLVSMRERAAFIDAELDVRSAPGRGTTVSLRVPCPAPVRPAVTTAGVERAQAVMP